MTQPPHPPEDRQTAGSPWQGLATGLIGFVAFVVGNTVLLTSSAGGHGYPHWQYNVVISAVILLLAALTGIALAVRGRSYALKGLGIGLVIGWALASIVSAGYCTGLNPGLYSALPL